MSTGTANGLAPALDGASMDTRVILARVLDGADLPLAEASAPADAPGRDLQAHAAAAKEMRLPPARDHH
ncbi:MAG: hypothetical protein ACHQ8D_22405, partial [Candidatus Rokuibacteriota bacterium]